jgi:homoserine kinase
LSISLPATSANLGPGFDAAALAFSLCLRVEVQHALEFSASAEGRDAELCRNPENNLILNTYREVLANAGLQAKPLSLRVHNEIPIGKGCGSSAAARLAGIALACHMGDLGWDDERIMEEASRREGHPDNAAACWLGGLAVARMVPRGKGVMAFQATRIVNSCSWPLLLAIPDAVLPTEQARHVLPSQYSRADVVANIQNSMFLLAAFVQGRKDLLRSALSDRIHEPYRAPLCPLLPAFQELAGTRGVIGATLSGAGPSVLLFLDSEIPIEQTIDRLRDHLAAKRLEAELIQTAIAGQGARESLNRERATALRR